MTSIPANPHTGTAQDMMRVFGHVDDDRLPVAALQAALFNDRSSLILVSDIDEIVDQAETGTSRRSNLFVVSCEFHESRFQPSKTGLDAITQGVSIALTLTHDEFSNRGWRATPEIGWVITDLPVPVLQFSLHLAVQGHCLVPNDARSTNGINRADNLRVDSMRIRDCVILMHIGLGKSDSTIARELGLSNLEIRRATNALYQELSVSTRAEAGAFYVRYRDKIVVHRKSLIRDSGNHARRVASRSVGD